MRFLPKIEEEEQQAAFALKNDEEVINLVQRENTNVEQNGSDSVDTDTKAHTADSKTINDDLPDIRTNNSDGVVVVESSEYPFSRDDSMLTSLNATEASVSLSLAQDGCKDVPKDTLPKGANGAPYQNINTIKPKHILKSQNTATENSKNNFPTSSTSENDFEGSNGTQHQIIHPENNTTSPSSSVKATHTGQTTNTGCASSRVKGAAYNHVSPSTKGFSNNGGVNKKSKTSNGQSRENESRESPSSSWSPYPNIPDMAVKGLKTNGVDQNNNYNNNNNNNNNTNNNTNQRTGSSASSRASGLTDKMVREHSSVKSDLNSLDLVRKYYSLFLDFSAKREPTQDEDDFHTGGNNERLEEVIKLHHLQQLMREFSQHRPKDIVVQAGSGYFPPKVLKRTPGCMNLEEFKATISKVLATDEYDDYLEKLFMKLDTSCDGYVDWNEFCTYMLLLYRENDYLRTKREIPFVSEPKIRHIVHNRQEQTSRVLAVHGPTRYVTISKEGAMSVWQPNMVLEKHYSIADQDDDPGVQKRRFKMWVTDAVYMKNCQKLAIGSTSRDVRFYDVSSSQYFEEYHLFAMSDVPYCFDYHYNEKHPNTDSLLVFGVDTGAIHLLIFHKPITQLFQNPFKSEGGVQKIFMQDLPGHNQWVSHTVLPDIHPEIIRQVRYLPDNQAIISASGCPKNTVVISDVVGVRKPYVFRIEKGVECFDHNKNLNLLVTGSGDHLVRLWNPYVTNKAVAILSGHATGVIGVAIHEGFRQVFSYSKDAVIKVWDTHEHTCLQTIMLKFPSSLHGRMPEHGQFPVHLQGNPHSALVVTCNDYVGALRLGKVEHNTSLMELTHDTQLCGAIYNKFFKQVATGCDSSTIAVWDIETGNKSIMFSNAHGEEEITAMTFDSNYRRLISGARNGTVKVWNFQNGHNLHKLESVGEAEVTGIHVLPEKRVILTVGWSQKITLYDDSDADNMYIPANNHWKGGQRHREDILSADYCHPNFLATASFDGEIIVWDVDSEKVYVTLRKGQIPNVSKKLEALKTQINNPTSTTTTTTTTTTNNNIPNNSNPNPDSRPPSRPGSQNSRPNSRHRSSHRVARGQPAPVDKLLFLKARMSIRFTESAVLISSEAGTLRWWSIYGTHREIGHFYAPGIADESVLAMTTKPNDSLLITGDTQGMIRCWDILDYCTRKDERTCRSPPPLETVWKAHDSAIVSVEYIVHDAGCFVLTASTDKTARLWSPEGHFVGTFGQKASWLLKNPSSWSHPDTPWTKEEEREAVERGEGQKVENGVEDGIDDDVIPDIEPEVDLPPGDITGFGRDTSSLLTAGDTNQNVHLTAPTPVMDSRQSTSISLPVSRQRNQTTEGAVESRPTSVLIAATPSSASRDPAVNYRLRYRSHTYAYGFNRAERAKTFLGIKVERDLERRQKDRKGRRVQYGEISAGRTSQFGKQCSPFHALSTPDWSEVQLPSNLPLSSRMINRGYTSYNLTTETINAMDFSYGGSDSPPATTSGEGRAATATRGTTDKTVPPPSREDKRVRLPPIKSGGVKKSPAAL